MNFNAEPGFVHCDNEPRYFVRSFDANDDRWKFGYRWQVQFLNDVGQGAASVEFGPHDDPDFSRLLSIELPQAVVEAARSGINDYVDSQGRRRQPQFLGGGLA